MAQINQNFTMYAGETKNIIVAVTNSDGTAVDLNGSTIDWVMQLSSNGKLTKNTTGGITITDATNGKFQINLLPADTQNLVGNFYHEAKIIDANGDVSIVLTGSAKILASHT